MKIVFNNSQKLNEIVFANRNKSYGAYAIRSAYNSTIFKSLGIVSSTVFLFFIGAYVFTKIDAEKIAVYLGPNDPLIEVPVDITPVDPPKTDPSGGKKTNSGPPIIIDHQDTLVEDPDPIPDPNPNPNGDPTATGTLTGTGPATVETQ